MQTSSKTRLVLALDRVPQSSLSEADYRVLHLYSELMAISPDIEVDVIALSIPEKGLIPNARSVLGKIDSIDLTGVSAVWACGPAISSPIIKRALENPRVQRIVDTLSLVSRDRRGYREQLERPEDISGDDLAFSLARDRDTALLRMANTVTIATPPEHRAIEGLVPGLKTQLVSSLPSQFADSEFSGRDTVLIMGSVTSRFGAPDELACQWFAQEVAPRIRRDNPSAEFLGLIDGVTPPLREDPTITLISDETQLSSGNISVVVDTDSFGRPNLVPLALAARLGVPLLTRQTMLSDTPRSVRLSSFADHVARRVLRLCIDPQSWQQARDVTSDLIASLRGSELLTGVAAVCARIGIASYPPLVRPSYSEVGIQSSRPTSTIRSKRFTRSTVRTDFTQTYGAWRWTGADEDRGVDISKWQEFFEGFHANAEVFDAPSIHFIVLPGAGDSEMTMKSLAAQSDTTSRVTNLTSNPEPLTELNSILDRVDADYVALLCSGAELHPDAVKILRVSLSEGSSIDFAFTDAIESDSPEGHVIFRRGWSPYELLERNFIGSFCLVRTPLLCKLMPLKVDDANAVGYEVALRSLELSPNVMHVAVPIITEPSLQTSAESVRELAAEQAAKCGWFIEAPTRRTSAAARVPIAGNPRVAVIIPTRDKVDLLKKCISSFQKKTTYKNYEFVIVDNDSVEPQTQQYFQTLPGKVIHAPGAFNFARMMNLGAYATDAEILLFLNNDIEIVQSDWLERLIEWAQLSNVGVVASRLLFPDKTLQHGGSIVGNAAGAALEINENLLRPHHGLRSELVADQMYLQDMCAVTAACMLMRSDVFYEVGGYDEQLRVAFNDVDLCLRIGALGYHVLYQPHSYLTHYESATRGRKHPAEDERRFKQRWDTANYGADPFFNPNFDPTPLPVLALRVPSTD